MRKTLLLITFFACSLSVLAQQGASSVESDTTVHNISDKTLLILAHQYQYGIKREASPKKAVAIYSYLARKNNAQAINQLGKCYLNGDGVKQNVGIAQRLFSKAAKMGNVRAKCNLAMIYQKGLNGKINYKKAYNLYKEAADSGSAQGMYGAGYLQYKGFGTEQNYAEAVKMLEKGAAKKHPGCDMLLASYYANGYDQEQDLDKAEKYYRNASRHGNSWTVDVTKNGLLDSIGKRRARKGTWKHLKSRELTEQGMPEISSTSNTDDIYGRWKGTAYTYDWSKKVILSEQDIMLNVECQDDSIHVNYYVGDSLSTAYAAVLREKGFQSKKLTDEQKEYSWTVTNTKFDIKNGKLLAEFRALNLDNMSFRKPLFAVLSREGGNLSTSSDTISTFSIERVSSESGRLAVSISASEEMDVDVMVSSVYGTAVENLGRRHLTKGHNKLTFRALSVKGATAYIVNVSRKDERHSKTVTVHSHE